LKKPTLDSHDKKKPWRAEFVSRKWVNTTENVKHRKF
jgi:hypothetical protein